MNYINPADSSSIRLILGLGNPGREYQNTRHNLGIKCVDFLAKNYSIIFSVRHTTSIIGNGIISGLPVTLAKPQTFMNRSGISAQYLLNRYQTSPEHLLVIYDDADLPLGKVRLRPNGTPGSHNGVRSIAKTLKTNLFPRLRIGIGPPPCGLNLSEFVLSRVSENEKTEIDGIVNVAAETIVVALTKGITEAMNQFN